MQPLTVFQTVGCAAARPPPPAADDDDAALLLPLLLLLKLLLLLVLLIILLLVPLFLVAVLDTMPAVRPRAPTTVALDSLAPVGLQVPGTARAKHTRGPILNCNAQEPDKGTAHLTYCCT